MAKKVTLEAAYLASNRANSLNLIRLILAAMVVIAHYYPLTRSIPSGWQTPFAQFGLWAVCGFFAISGYLIAGSWENSSNAWGYLKRRILRIYPAFWMALLVTAFIIAPVHSLIKEVESLYPWNDAFLYVVSNSSLVIFQHRIGNTLESSAYPQSWNGSLWTLAPEFICYLLLGVFFAIFRSRRLSALIALIILGTTAFFIFEENPIVGPALRAGVFFLAGMIVYLQRSKVALSWPWLLALSVPLALTWNNSTWMILLALPTAILLLSAGAHKSQISFTVRNDYSYGLYIYAFPVQQLVATFMPNLSLTMHVSFSLAIAFLLAATSWHLIEKPAIQLAKG